MHTDIMAAIAVASESDLDAIVQAATAAWAKGDVEDEAYSAIYGAAHRRRADLRVRAEASTSSPGRRSVFPVRPPQRSPDRQRSLERRRRLAASGPLPPRLASLFTLGEQATLKIITDEVRENGRCDRSIDEIAARAGGSRSVVKRALRVGARHGLLRVTERPRPGNRHLTNVVEIVSPEWRLWIERGPKGRGVQDRSTTATKGKKGFEQKLWRGRESHRRQDSREVLGSPPERERRAPAGAGRAGPCR